MDPITTAHLTGFAHRGMGLGNVAEQAAFVQPPSAMTCANRAPASDGETLAAPGCGFWAGDNFEQEGLEWKNEEKEGWGAGGDM